MKGMFDRNVGVNCSDKPFQFEKMDGETQEGFIIALMRLVLDNWEHRDVLMSNFKTEYGVDLVNEFSRKFCGDLKKECEEVVSENLILWNEITCLKDDGIEFSEEFQDYLCSIESDYDSYWESKIKRAMEHGVI